VIPGDPVACELKICRFGKNLVCSVWIHNELFLYPAFVMGGESSVFSAVVGQERDGSNAMIGWSGAEVAVIENPAPIAA